MWVIQECVLPDSAAIYFGAFKVQFAMFSLAALALVQHSAACCATTFHSLSEKEKDLLDHFSKAIMDIAMLASNLRTGA